MPRQSLISPNPALPALPLDSTAARVVAVLLGTLVLTLSSRLQVPMVPVPMTMQTLAVTLIGALYGWRLGALTVLVWLAQGLVGLPVFAGGAGPAYMVGPTGGYLVAFVFAAAVCGALAERGWTGHRVLRSFAAQLAGNLLCLAIGAAWLATFVGPTKAVAAGVLPFVLGGVLKSILGAALLKALALQRGR